MPEIRSISICGELVMDMHSLNNEGAEGNQLLTRMVHVVDMKNGENRLAVVNAISGDMMKHIQAGHFHAVATARQLPLCAGCAVLDANRINADTGFFDTEIGDKKDNPVILNQVITRCAMDDTEGILITRGNRSTPRKSTVEFAWLVGVPRLTRTESFFHVKYDPAARGAGAGGEEGANVGQNIFYRPASSGVYAAVVNLELWRVGFNDITREYVIPPQERQARRRALLESVAFTFLKPAGAHRNTQNPHILAFKGVLAFSRGPAPAPTASALNAGYAEEVEGVGAELNRLWPGTIAVQRFGSQAEFARLMTDLAEGGLA